MTQISSTLKRDHVFGTHLAGGTSRRLFLKMQQMFPAKLALIPGRSFAGETGWAVTSGDVTTMTLTGQTDAKAIVTQLPNYPGMKIASVDLVATITAPGALATATITCVAKADLVNDDFFTLLNANADGDSIVFFYDLDGGSVTVEDDTHVKIDIAADTTAANVATTTAGVINAVVGGTWSADPNVADVDLEAEAVGAEFNVTHTENVTNAGFLITAATGGADASLDALTVTVKERRIEDDGTAPTDATLATVSASADDIGEATNKAISLVMPSHEFSDGAAHYLEISGDLEQSSDALLLKAVRVTYDNLP